MSRINAGMNFSEGGKRSTKGGVVRGVAAKVVRGAPPTGHRRSDQILFRKARKNLKCLIIFIKMQFTKFFKFIAKIGIKFRKPDRIISGEHLIIKCYQSPPTGSGDSRPPD